MELEMTTFYYCKKGEETEYPIELIKSFTFWKRFMGLMGKKSSHPGMIFNQTNQVHMFFMQFPIDVYYLDKTGIVIHMTKSLKPWRIGPRVKGAYYVIEFPAGGGVNLEIGDQFRLTP